jgi:hypothetical protein
MQTNFSLINEKTNVFIKTEKGIIEIDTEKIPQFLRLLREKLSLKESYRVTGIGLDTSINEYKVNFTESLIAEGKDAIREADQIIIKDNPNSFNNHENNAELQITAETTEEEETITLASRKAKREYDFAVRDALQIIDLLKRSEALQKSAENFETSVNKSGKEFIREIKKESTIYLNYIQAIDPVNFEEIKKAVEENIRFRENAVNSSNNASIQAIQVHIDSVKAAAPINDLHERETVLTKANNDLNNKLLTWRNIMTELLKTLTVNIPQH